MLVSLNTGADPGFQVRGAHFKKSRRAEGGAKTFGVFRVKNHDFTQNNLIFFPILGGRGAPGAPPLNPPLEHIPNADMRITTDRKLTE